DLHTSALVKDGSIDWLCLPHFDSPSLFARNLDKEGGHFSVKNRGYNVKSDYDGLTAITKTSFKSQEDSFEIKDFMVPQQKPRCHEHLIVRKIKALGGSPKVKLDFSPKPDYAKRKPKIKKSQNELILRHNGKDVKLSLPEGSEIKKYSDGYEITLNLKKDEEKEIIIYQGNCSLKNQDFEKITRKFWEKWVSKGKFMNFCKTRMARSAITLKLMQFYPTGAIIASPTTSLPEEIGGERNWDYRYSWIRDATFTLYGLHVLGYREEAERFFSFIEKVAKKCKGGTANLDLVYTIDGNRVLGEKKLNHLEGYKKSKPVRIGNDAAKQFQLDVYGSLLDSYYFMSKRDLKISSDGKRVVKDLVEAIKKNWKKPDNGIWEVRKNKEDFTYSKVMAWVGVDRAIRLANKLKIPKKKVEEWKALRHEISSWIWENCFDSKKEKFKQHPNTKKQDATNCLFVLLQFLDKHDKLTQRIIDNTCKELSYKEVFVYRYKGSDGLPGKEGAFILCTFWLVSSLGILEKVSRSKKLFNEFEKHIKPLLSEEIEPKTKSYLGNFPQAFSHIGYIMSAYYLDRYEKKLGKK
ncbi:MAG: glycoside hydrolase family 15 protein, partial [Candidatus Pacearchaeota archaeon]